MIKSYSSSGMIVEKKVIRESEISRIDPPFNWNQSMLVRGTTWATRHTELAVYPLDQGERGRRFAEKISLRRVSCLRRVKKGKVESIGTVRVTPRSPVLACGDDPRSRCRTAQPYSKRID